MTAQLLSIPPSCKLFSQRKILLIEDNDINRMLLSDYLGFFNYYVKSLPDASNLSNIIEQFKPALILLDLKLPNIDGFQVLEMIQEHSDWSKIPTIAVSALAFKSDYDRAFSLGVKRYFVKPVNLPELMLAIADEIDCSKQ